MLIDRITNRELKINDVVYTSKGVRGVITGIADLVYIKTDKASQPYGVFPAVINAKGI